MKIKFFCKTWYYYSDFTTRINECFDQMLAKQNSVLFLWNPLKFESRLIENHSKICFYTDYNYQYKGCQDRHQFELFIRILVSIITIFVIAVIINLSPSISRFLFLLIMIALTPVAKILKPGPCNIL